MPLDFEQNTQNNLMEIEQCWGVEILHISNPDNYDYNEDAFGDPEYEIFEVGG